MNRKRSSLFLTLVASGALALGLIGCGGGGYSKPPSTAPPYMPPAASKSYQPQVTNPSVPAAPAAQAQAAR